MAVVTAGTPGARRLSARVAVVVVLAVAAGLVFVERTYRALEIELAGLLLRLVTSSGVHVVSERETVYFGLSGDNPLGLRMTPECSSVFLLIPLLLVTAAMLWFRPQNALRLAVTLAISAVAVILVNQLRILAIVGLVNWLGVSRGYYWGHTLLGSLVSVIGGAVALVLFVWLATRKPKAKATRP
ncbi:exosortase P [Saccharomonospora sp. NPDC046836]|uniref:exosortase P n=1 Tax=Saccharomonospora sp. NPDC046836 TaxID=3156921 RepID=UPI0033C06DEE